MIKDNTTRQIKKSIKVQKIGKCRSCGKKFRWYQTRVLYNNTNYVGKEQQKKYVCDECDKSKRKRIPLKYEFNGYTLVGEIKRECPLCGEDVKCYAYNKKGINGMIMGCKICINKRYAETEEK